MVASIYDYRTREVPNTVWKIALPISIGITTFEFMFSSPTVISALVTSLAIGIPTAIFIGVFYLGFFGGADAKALMTLSILIPFQPEIAQPFLGVLPFFAMSIFNNSLLLSLLVIPYALVSNVMWKVRTQQALFEGFAGESVLKRIAATALCIKISSSSLKKYDFLAERGNEFGSRRLILFQRLGDEEEPSTAKFENLPQYIFVSAGIPMIIFITAGFVVSLLVGDLIFASLGSFLS